MSIFSSWRGGAELRRHHVERRRRRTATIAGVALADAGRLDDHQVEAGGLARARSTSSRCSGTSPPAARVASERKNDAGRRVERVHPDAVAEQRAAAAAPGRVDGEHGDRAACPPGRAGSRRTSSSVSDDLPEPPVPVMPSTGHRARRRPPRARGAASAGRAAGLEHGDRPGQRARGRRRAAPSTSRRRSAARSTSQARDQLVDHAGPGPGAGRPRARRCVTPALVQQRRSPPATITPPPPPNTCTCPAPPSASRSTR